MIKDVGKIAIAEAKGVVKCLNSIIDNEEKARDHAMESGKFLIEKKKELTHGEFIPWIEKNMPIGRHQCRNYMKMYDRLGGLKGERALLLPDSIRGCVDLADVKIAEEKKAEKAEKDKIAREKHKKEVAKFDDDSAKLFNYKTKLIGDVEVPTNKRYEIEKYTTAEEIFNIGYDSCKEKIDSLFESSQKVEPEAEKEDEEKPRWESSATKRRNARFEELLRNISSNGNEEAVELLSILTESNDAVRIKVFKVMKQCLHPDNKATGDEELFKRLKPIEEYFNEK